MKENSQTKNNGAYKMTSFDRLKQAFTNTLHEDLILSWQEQNNIMDFPSLVVTDNQRQTIDELLRSILMRIGHNGFTDYLDNPDEVGGDLYIGLMYDSYDTPLAHLDGVDWHCELSAFTNPDNDNQLLFEGYIEFAGKHYTF